MKPITIVGLGPGDPDQMSRAAWNVIQAAPLILARTRIHPTIHYLESFGVIVESCDDLYEATGSFEQIYEAIADRVMERAGRGEAVVFAVPGHPLFGERSVELLRQRASEAGVELDLVPSPGFLDVVIPAVGLDVGAGLALLDGAAPQPPPPGLHAIYYQVYNRLVASDLKLLLLESLPPQTLIWHVRSAGAPEEIVRQIPLYTLDRLDSDHLTSIVIPANALNGPAPPVLTHADEVFQSAAEVGFDWPDWNGPLDKIIEELDEIRQAVAAQDRVSMADEVGDLFLAAVNLSRKLDVDPDEATREALLKFIRRFQSMEFLAGHRPLTDFTPQQLDELWEAAKAEEGWRATGR
ncbi:MAG TPA: SAM-dependent methyltransferase [Armatimonadota bacterium]|nr:SAM-dependent methyltransferase [Armatimonadota bacterium]